MTRADLPRPTLFGPTGKRQPPQAAGALRMLSRPHAPVAVRGASRRRLGTLAVGIALVIATGSVLVGRTPEPPPKPADAPAPAPPPLDVPAPRAAAVIESMPPAVALGVAPPTVDPALARATSTGRLAAPRSKAPAAPRPAPSASPAAPRTAATPDADVDLLAAMVTRLQAADGNARAASSASPADGNDDSRAAAR